MRIAILMTTYNGEAFLPQQLDSIIDQTFTDWVLYVRDDSSSDSTSDIIESYMKRDKRIVLVSNDVKLGAMKGFMTLLEETSADYYMFCDHDDFWFKDKIERTLDVMLQTEKVNPGIPVVVGTDQSIADQDLSVIHESFRKVTHYSLSQLNDKFFHLFYNDIQGCTMMLDNMARDIALPYNRDAVMHDWWIMLSVLWKGGVVGYVDSPTMLYRQHSGNHTGVHRVRGMIGKLRNFSSIMEKTRQQYNSTKDITGLGWISFILLKTAYMLKMQWNLRVRGLFDKNRL